MRHRDLSARPAHGNCPSLLEILMCPRCRGRLASSGTEVSCTVCAGVYPVVDGVPVLTPEPHSVDVRPDHVSNEMPEDLVDRLAGLDGYWLHLGAGATKRAVANCVEVEWHVFANTTVVADSSRLPFVDASFNAALSFNTFEHLPEPVASAAELYRVLVPGGRLYIRTAFMQPLHADPSHYFNTTEAGVRHWFREFDIDVCDVPWSFNPVFSLGWLASDLLHLAGGLGQDAVRQLERSTLAEWSVFWRQPERRSGPLWDLMHASPGGRQAPAGRRLRAARPEAVGSLMPRRAGTVPRVRTAHSLGRRPNEPPARA